MTDRDRDVENDEEPVDEPQMDLPEHIVDAAVRGGTAEDLEVVKIWIEKTQNVNATHTTTSPYHADRTGQTLLYTLSCCRRIVDGGRSILSGTITPAKLDLVRLLIARGADVNMRASDGNSPLHQACTTTSPTLVSLLLDAGAADLNFKNRLAETPLALAISSSKNKLEISRILIRAGASLDCVSGGLSAEQHLDYRENIRYNHFAGDERWRALKNLVYGTRTRRAIARLRSYAIRGRVTAEVRLLDDFALARVKLYNSLFGLPHDLFKEIVSKL